MIEKANALVHPRMILKVSAISLCVRIWLVALKWTCIAMNDIMEGLPTLSPKWVIEGFTVDLLPRKSPMAVIDPRVLVHPSMEWTTLVADLDQILANHTRLGQLTIKSPCPKKKSKLFSTNCNRNSDSKWTVFVICLII